MDHLHGPLRRYLHRERHIARCYGAGLYVLAAKTNRFKGAMVYGPLVIHLGPPER